MAFVEEQTTKQGERFRRNGAPAAPAPTTPEAPQAPEAPQPPKRVDVFRRAQTDARTAEFRMSRGLGLSPYFRPLDDEAGPVVNIEGRDRIMLGSNNYLGLTRHPRVKEAAEAALKRYGTALTGSRLFNGTLGLHEELEYEIAQWLGAEEALVFTTGYQANLGCLSGLAQPGDTIVCDSSNHASILDGAALSHATLRPYRHGRLDRLEAVLRKAADDNVGTLVVVDGVFSMEGEVCDLRGVGDLCRAYGARLVVDEAHGVGVLGATGAGATQLLGVEDVVDMRTGTFSKALASCGGFVAGPRAVIEYLRVQSRPFIFTAAAVPAALAAALAAVRICNSDEGPQMLERTLDNARYLREGLTALGYRIELPDAPPGASDIVTPITPVIIGEDWHCLRFWKALYNEGVYTNAAVYPGVPRGSALLRTSVMATHEREQLDQALEAFERVAHRVGMEES